MADRTSSSILVQASPVEVMDVIADFPSYPDWATGVRQAEVVQTGPDGRAQQVFFVLDAAPIKDEYTLNYDWHDEHAVRWTLVRGQVLKAMDGSYELKAHGEQTEVTYRLAVDVHVPLIGGLKRKAEKVVVDAALRGLKERVESGRAL